LLNGRTIKMRIPQVTDRMKAAPTQALRTLFAGIGQLLMAADRAKSRTGEPDSAGLATAERPQRPPNAPAVASEPYSARWRSFDKTGNVRILPPGELAHGTGAETIGVTTPAAEVTTPAAEPAEVTEPTAEPAAVAEVTEPTAEPAAVAEVTEPTAVAGPLPVPNYDDLSLASLRARLRHLDRAQLRVLLGYERANAGREAVLTMFERRIAKLDSGEA
jgi:hypothetical protein